MVVDPGVGTARKAIAVQAMDEIFIAPDNGVLTLVLSRTQNFTVREIADPRLMLPSPATTFHGRDIFAPAAATIACGAVPFSEVGPIVENLVLLSPVKPQLTAPGLWEGRVLSVDHFGNLITNFPVQEFESRRSD